MFKYRAKISLVADDTISLNEFKATLAGSDLEISDIVLQGESIDKMLEAKEKQLEELDLGGRSADNLDYYSRNDRNGNGNGNKSDNLPKRPKRPASQKN
jgi:ribonuclease G